jgi:hypothetical protein
MKESSVLSTLRFCSYTASVPSPLPYSFRARSASTPTTAPFFNSRRYALHLTTPPPTSQAAHAQYLQPAMGKGSKAHGTTARQLGSKRKPADTPDDSGTSEKRQVRFLLTTFNFPLIPLFPPSFLIPILGQLGGLWVVY